MAHPTSSSSSSPSPPLSRSAVHLLTHHNHPHTVHNDRHRRDLFAALAVGAFIGGATVAAAFMFWIKRQQRKNRLTRQEQVRNPVATADNRVAMRSYSPSSVHASLPHPAPLSVPPSLLSLASTVPYLSPAMKLHHFGSRGIGFIATRDIEPGELLLIDSVISVSTRDDLPYDWHAYAQLVEQFHHLHPSTLSELFVSNSSQSAIEEEFPVPEELRASPIEGITNDEWMTLLHAVANNAYICEEGDLETNIIDESQTTILSQLQSDSLRSSRSVDDAGDNDATTLPPITTTTFAVRPRCTMNLHLLTCKLNHSCFPSACLSGGRVWSCAKIAAGEEICVSYLLPEQGLYLPTADRRDLLHKSRSFTCECERCIGSSPKMIELETILSSHTMDKRAFDELQKRIALVLNDVHSTDDSVILHHPDAVRTLLSELDSLYHQLPASHSARFLFRRYLLITPPEWMTPNEYVRLLLEHICVIQLILPEFYLYKIYEIEELFQAFERSGIILIQDVQFLLPRLDSAFDRNVSPLFTLSEHIQRANHQVMTDGSELTSIASSPSSSPSLSSSCPSTSPSSVIDSFHPFNVDGSAHSVTPFKHILNARFPVSLPVSATCTRRGCRRSTQVQSYLKSDDHDTDLSEAGPAPFSFSSDRVGPNHLSHLDESSLSIVRVMEPSTPSSIISSFFAPLSPSRQTPNSRARSHSHTLSHSSLSSIGSTESVPSDGSSSSSSSSFSTSPVSTYICASCGLPLVACSPDCHYALLKYHQQICEIIALTMTE